MKELIIVLLMPSALIQKDLISVNVEMDSNFLKMEKAALIIAKGIATHRQK